MVNKCKWTAQQPNKITSTNNRWAPTIFAYEDVDPSNGISDGYSDAKITTYNLSTTGVNNYLTDEQRNSYSYEKYNEDPGLKVIYNSKGGSAIEILLKQNRNRILAFVALRVRGLGRRCLLLALYVKWWHIWR